MMTVSTNFHTDMIFIESIVILNQIQQVSYNVVQTKIKKIILIYIFWVFSKIKFKMKILDILEVYLENSPLHGAKYIKSNYIWER